MKYFLDPNANQFVNQGYNNIDFSPSPNQAPRSYGQPQFQQPAGQQPQQQAGVRIIPIKVEGATTPVIMQR